MMRGMHGSAPIEILIALPILGILAGVVVLQTASASADPRESMLQADLRVVRDAIQKYGEEHMGNRPDGTSLMAQLCARTDHSGAVMPSGGDIAKYPFGPYLHSFPSNLFVTDPALANTIKTGTSACPGDGTSGWYFNVTLGVFSPNDPGHK